MLWWVFTPIAGHARWHLLCACPFLEAVMGLSSLLPNISLRLLTSPVRTHLTLTGPHWGPQSPHPQSGVPPYRFRTHSLSRVQNKAFQPLQNVDKFQSRPQLFLELYNTRFSLKSNSTSNSRPCILYPVNVTIQFSRKLFRKVLFIQGTLYDSPHFKIAYKSLILNFCTTC